MVTQRPISAAAETRSIVRLRWLTIAIWLFWILVYWNGGEKATTDFQKAWKNKESRLDLAAIAALMIFSIPVVGSILVMTLRRDLRTSSTLGRTGTLIGTLLTGGGVAGMSISRSYLGKFWTTHASIQAEHDIVDQGPYGWVRHPIYTSALAIYAGTAMVFPTRRIVLLSMLTCLAYAFKAEAEEKLLLQYVPGYAAYQEQVRSRLLPGLW